MAENMFPSPQNDPFEQAYAQASTIASVEPMQPPSLPIAHRWQIKTDEEIADSQKTVAILEQKLGTIRSGAQRSTNPGLHPNYESEDETDEEIQEETDQEGVHLLWKANYEAGGSSSSDQELLWSRAWQKRKSEEEYMPWVDRILGCFICCK
ncbi:hypothetical protein CLU79DRAFT_840817 [Phycomyces nitens]|nr:hypothetical protein CLU79DRAFT_840817 [Phycomyces nitens]